MGGASPLAIASYVGGAIACTMRAPQVDRLQRRRDLAAAETGEDREAW